ncbi:hypothetical protein ACHQM5_012149 [Ranunculus cassubicifolius]
MGRPPCCDKVGIKKGPWTPEEDIILVSYIQEQGPGNWRSVPTNTGLLRCSKSCRLRWTNYLRPGIKRGNFTPHEEGMIIHLQALLGNKWAAIASYLPQRTDNDIKNYWNTHLKKKIKKFQSALAPETPAVHLVYNSKKSGDAPTNPDSLPTSSSTYASSTENISRLLEGWMKTSTSPKDINLGKPVYGETQNGSFQCNDCNHDEDDDDNEDLQSLLSFQNNMSSLCWDKFEEKMESHPPPLSFLEKWLLDEAAGAGGQGDQGTMELSPMSDNIPNI